MFTVYTFIDLSIQWNSIATPVLAVRLYPVSVYGLGTERVRGALRRARTQSIACCMSGNRAKSIAAHAIVLRFGAKTFNRIPIGFIFLVHMGHRNGGIGIAFD